MAWRKGREELRTERRKQRSEFSKSVGRVSKATGRAIGRFLGGVGNSVDRAVNWSGRQIRKVAKPIVDAVRRRYQEYRQEQKTIREAVSKAQYENYLNHKASNSPSGKCDRVEDVIADRVKAAKAKARKSKTKVSGHDRANQKSKGKHGVNGHDRKLTQHEQQQLIANEVLKDARKR